MTLNLMNMFSRIARIERAFRAYLEAANDNQFAIGEALAILNNEE